MKKLVLSLSLIAAVCITMAQPKIEFEKKTHEFGDIREEGGKVTARFTFKNVGDQPLELKNVKPGCGCTAANYTKTAVAPGETGYIDATYDPWGRPGAFNKNIKVTTNEENVTTPYLIFIKGNVIKRPPTKYELAGYKSGKGDIRVKESQVRFNVTNTSYHLDTFYMKNFYEDGTAISVKLEQSTYITEHSRSFGEKLEAGQEGYVVLKYDGAARGAWGSQKDRAVFVTNDSIEPRKYVHYAVTVEEDFSNLSPKDIEKAPMATFDKVAFNFDTIAQNTSATEVVKITNTGKKTLIIRKLDPSMPALTYKISTLNIEPGQSATLELTFKAQSRRNRQECSIDVITNSPKHPVQTIKVTGFVKQ